MENKKLIKLGIINALGTALYVFLLALFFSQANKIFGAEDNELLAPVVALLLFIVSALVTGGLVLGRPILMYWDGLKKEAVKLLVYTGLSLFVILLLVGTLLVVLK
jgi:hypothetical protein